MPRLRANPVGTILSRAEPWAGASDAPEARERAMASVVNLNRFRKTKKSAEAERRAAANRAAFGRSKTERRKADEERERSERDLDGKRIE